MRTWWKSLGWLAAGLGSLGILAAPVRAQFLPPGRGMGPPPGMFCPPGGCCGAEGPVVQAQGSGERASPFTIREEGMPNAFTDMAPPQRMNCPPVNSGGGAEGQFVPAEFPNPSKGSKEPDSPFSMRDEGVPGAFTELLSPLARDCNPYILALRGEYLNWRFTKGPSTTPLVITNPNFPVEIGALNQPSTSVLFPADNNGIDFGSNRGFRLTAGLAIGYIPPIEISGFLFNRSQALFSAGSLTNPTQFLAIPLQDVSQPTVAGTGTETALFIAIPASAGVGTFGGTVSINSQFSYWGIEAIGLYNFAATDHFKVDILLGYRHAQLNDSININTQTGGPNSGGVFFGGITEPPGFVVSSIDSFRARNAFDGAQMGFRTLATMNRFSLFTDLKMALGNTQHLYDINGSTTLSQPVAAAGRPSQTLPGGVLALPSNSGNHSENTFGFIPEANFTLSCQLNSHFRLFGGYNLTYWSNVVRPGDAIITVVDSRQIPSFGANYSPSTASQVPGPPSFVRHSFTAQGLFVGLEIGF